MAAESVISRSCCLIAALTALVVNGCAWHAERVAERAAPTGVEATLEMFAEKDNQLMLAEVVQTVFSEGVVRGIARGAAGGVMESLVADQILTPQFQSEVRQFASAVARDVSASTIMGSHAAIAQLREADPDTPLPVIGRVEGWMDQGVYVAIVAAIVLGLAAGVLAILLGIIVSRNRRSRVASEWRLATALLLVQAFRRAPDGKVQPEVVDDLFNRLQEADRPDSMIHALRDRLGQTHPHAEHGVTSAREGDTGREVPPR